MCVYEIADDGVRRVIRAKKGELLDAAAGDKTITVKLSQVRLDKEAATDDREGVSAAAKDLEINLRPLPERLLVKF